MTESRHDYDESICRLQQLGFVGPDEHPAIPDHVPQPDDNEPLGLSFFRTFVGEDADLSNLTIPRTLFGRSEINGASFQNTDLTESNLRWNDFVGVDFTDAVLAHCDLRASIFTRVRFIRADFRGADMRRSTFNDCIFDEAMMHNAILTYSQGATLNLEDWQRWMIDWRHKPGPEPTGG